MGNELTIGSVGISVVLVILLKMIYNTFDITNKYKPWIAVIIGVALSMVWMIANSVAMETINVITYGVQGFMTGATAVGLHEMTKTTKKVE